MPKYPKIKLIIDIERDVNNGINFVNTARKGDRHKFLLRFLPTDFQYVLSKDFSKKEKDKIIEKYARHIHKIRKDKIKNGLTEAKNNWQKVEKEYFHLVDKIFKNYPWPKGNYRGIASIWWMFPRYIKEKVFFFPYGHSIPKFSNGVIAHEMLHFIFFDYIEKRYGLKEGSNIKEKPDRYVWRVSEVFNNVMEDWKPYYQLFKRKPRPYEGNEEIFRKMKKQWRKKKDVDWLLDLWFLDKKKK